MSAKSTILTRSTDDPLSDPKLTLGPRLMTAHHISQYPLPSLAFYSHKDTGKYKAAARWPNGINPETVCGHNANVYLQEIMGDSAEPGDEWRLLGSNPHEIDDEELLPALKEEVDRVKTLCSEWRESRSVGPSLDIKSFGSTKDAVSDRRATGYLKEGLRKLPTKAFTRLDRDVAPLVAVGVTPDVEEEMKNVVKGYLDMEAESLGLWYPDYHRKYQSDEKTVLEARERGDFPGAIAAIDHEGDKLHDELLAGTSIANLSWQYTPSTRTGQTASIKSFSRDKLVSNITDGILGKWNDAPKSLANPSIPLRPRLVRSVFNEL
jgi:hypothetical protein